MSGAEKRGRWGRKWREGVVWPLRGWEWLQLGGRTTWRFKVIAVSQDSIQMRPWGQDIKSNQIMSPHNSVSRFVDYFVICGYDHTKGRPGGRESCSQVHTKHPRSFLDIIRDTDVDFFLQIVQRFPERDWPDIPFVHGLDRFCQVENFTCSSFQFLSVMINFMWQCECDLQTLVCSQNYGDRMVLESSNNKLNYHICLLKQSITTGDWWK